jgi:hypothetical protein
MLTVLCASYLRLPLSLTYLSKWKICWSRSSSKWKYYILTPWNKVLLEKITASQLVKKFPAFYGTRKFITAFTSARHLTLSWVRSIQFITHTWKSILILSSYPWMGLPSSVFHLGFPIKTLYTPLLFPTVLHAFPHLFLLYLIACIIQGYS